MELKAEDLQHVQGLYDRGLFLQAYRCTDRLGPLQEWSGTRARILAGRISARLGAPRLGEVLHYLAWRAEPADPQAIYYRAWSVWRRQGLLAALDFLETADLPASESRIRADFLVFRAHILGYLRDFDTAEDCMNQALELAPDVAWIHVERSALLQLEDRCEEALASAQRALELRPWYAPGIDATAETLQQLNRQEEALALLTEAATRIESPSTVAELAALQMELGCYQQANESYARIRDLAPIMEKDFAGWLTARCSGTAYLSGDVAQMRRLARETDDSVREHINRWLTAQEREGKRCQLKVSYVRQHHVTCAPATLTAISLFWGKSANHLELAEAICYDGTPNHSSRRWAEQNGWSTREFVVTWDAAVDLVDRGIPFTVSLTRAAAAHMVAVIGYDSRLRTLLLRDPSVPRVVEVAADSLLADQSSTGPRAMVMVPQEKADLLAGLNLPESELYDRLYAMELALHEHDRARAQTAYESLVANHPESRLTRYARLILATYDQDETARLAYVDQELKHFPDDPNLLLFKVGCLHVSGRRTDRISLLREVYENGTGDPILWQVYAEELAQDARQHDQAYWLLKRSLRYRLQARGLYTMATILWRRRQFEKALRLYHFAACLDDKNGGLAATYFQAAQFCKQTPRVLESLRRREQRFGGKACEPAQTLFWAYERLNRTHEGLEALEEAMRRRPDDGDLMLFAANAYASCGQTQRATSLLQQAEPKSRRASWLRMAAELARRRGNLPEALKHWQEVLGTEPLAMDAHRAIASLLASTDSQAAALEHVEAAVGRFPHSYPLHQLYVEMLRDVDGQKAEHAASALIEINPADVWANRELAFLLGRRNQLDEALARAETARQLDPTDSYTLMLLGELLTRAGRLVAGTETLRQAIRMQIDNGGAIARLMQNCRTDEERREALAFLRDELTRQVVFGEGLLAYHGWAHGTLEPQEVLQALQEGLDARPDLWQAWVAVTRQLSDMNRLDEALATAREATDRFPLVAAVWYRLSEVHRARKEPDLRIEALRQANALNSDEPRLACEFAIACQEKGDADQARSILEQVIARNPLDGPSHGVLADIDWKAGRRELALERLEKALLLDPSYDWGWNTIFDWGRALGKPAAPVFVARVLTRTRGGEARNWLILARMPFEQFDQRLAAANRAIELEPGLAEAHDVKAELLADAGLYDEAFAACEPAALNGNRPLALRGREAWLYSALGDIAEAAKRMRDVVRDEPGYTWGMILLIDWYIALRQPQEALEVAEQLVRWLPNAAFAYIRRANANLKIPNHNAVKKDLERALSIEPENAEALFRLFDLHLESRNEFELAAQVLERLKQTCPGEHTLAREVMLAARDYDEAAATDALRRLCELELSGPHALDQAIQAMLHKGWRATVSNVLDRALENPNTSEAVAELWGRGFAVHLWRWKCWKRLKQLRKKGPLGWIATAAYVETCIDTPADYPAVKRFINKYWKTLRPNDRVWASVTYALVSLDRQHAAYRWTRDWAQRVDVTAHTLLLVGIAMRHLGKFGQATEVALRATALPLDSTTRWHHLWLAFDEASMGRRDAAMEQMRRVRIRTADPLYYKALAEMVEAMLVSSKSGKANDKQSFTAARERLKNANHTRRALRADRDLRHAYVRAVKRIAKDHPGTFSSLWRITKRLLA